MTQKVVVATDITGILDRNISVFVEKAGEYPKQILNRAVRAIVREYNIHEYDLKNSDQFTSDFRGIPTAVLFNKTFSFKFILLDANVVYVPQ